MGARQLSGEVLVRLAAVVVIAGCSGANTVTSDDLTRQSLNGSATGPEAPSAMTATAVSTSEISLAWQDNSSTETGFLLESRTASATTYTVVATVAANVKTYQHKGLQPSTQYIYHLRSCIDSKCSERAAEASAMTQGPVIPAGVLTVATREASSVSGRTATIGGSVTPNRLATTAWVEYGTTATLAGAVASEARNAGDGATAFSYEVRLEGLASGTTYYHRAVAANSAGRVNGPIKTFRTSDEAPAPVAPQALQGADDANAMAVSLAWTHDGANGVTFTVRRRTASESAWLVIATLPNSARAYRDAAYELQSRHEYVYRVDACKGEICAASGTVALTTALLAAPTSLVVTALSATSIQLSWTDSNAHEDGFIVSRRVSTEGSFVTVATPASATTSASITGLVAGQSYTFKVAAFKGATADGSRRSAAAELSWTNAARP